MKKYLLILLSFACLNSTAEPKRIYIACDDHTDYLWSADEETYRQAFIRMLDYYLDLADTTSNEPPDYQSRFVCDGFYWMWVYQQAKSPEEFNRLVERIKSGHITVPMNTLSCCYGATPMEAVLRSMYYAGTVQRNYQLPFRLALEMENQTMPWGLASLWAGCGAEFSWKGICKCATRIDDCGDREHEIYNWVGPDGQKILIKWNSILTDNQSMGGYAEARDPKKVIEFVTTNQEFMKRYPYPIIGCFGKGWDDLQTLNDEFPKIAKNLSNENQQVIVSNVIDFFDDFQKKYGDRIPQVNVSFGNEWEILYASLAEVSASVKRSLEKLRTAEAMAAIVSLYDSQFSLDDETRQTAFIDLGMFFEHDWTGDGPVPRKDMEQYKRRMSENFRHYVDALYEKSSVALANLIPANESKTVFYVFNPLGWQRSDYADLAYFSKEPVHVVDVRNGREIPYQWIKNNGVGYLRIWANDIPAVGYQCYEIHPGKSREFKNCGTFNDTILENQRYRLSVLSNGSITGLADKQKSHREFALKSEGSAINELGTAPGMIQVENTGPVSITLRADVSSPLKRTTRITLYRDGSRIDISNEIEQNFSDIQSYTFGFNLKNPLIRHEEVGAIARADYQKNGGDYADRNGRYDWLTFNHFADISGSENIGVTLSNADGYFFKTGDSEVKKLDTSKAILHALIGGQVDGKNLGAQNQGGDAYFLNRYAIQTHAEYDPVASMKFSLEHQNPLRAAFTRGVNPKLPATSFSALNNSNPSVLPWTIKPAESDAGEGIVVRLWNLSDNSQTTDIQLNPYTIQQANSVTHLETDRDEVPVTGKGINVDFNRQQIRTFRLVPQK